MHVRGSKNVKKSAANGSNIVSLRFGDQGTKEMFQALDNSYQQHATECANRRKK